MRRGTTPMHTFTLSVDHALIDKLRVFYAQMGQVILTKTEADVKIDGNVVQVRLTEEETLAFHCKQDVEIQLKILTTAGDVLVTDIFTISVGRCLSSEVIA